MIATNGVVAKLIAGVLLVGAFFSVACDSVATQSQAMGAEVLKSSHFIATLSRLPGGVGFHLVVTNVSNKTVSIEAPSGVPNLEIQYWSASDKKWLSDLPPPGTFLRPRVVVLKTQMSVDVSIDSPVPRPGLKHRVLFRVSDERGKLQCEVISNEIDG